MPRAQLPLAIAFPRARDFSSFRVGDNAAAVAAVAALPNDRRASFFARGQRHRQNPSSRRVLPGPRSGGGASRYVAPASWAEDRTEALLSFADASLLALDGLEDLAGRRALEEAVFALFNAVRDRGGGVLVASREHPEALSDLLPDLRSRLLAGLRFRLQPLPEEERRALFRARTAEVGLRIEDAALEYLFRRYPRDLKRLMAFLERLEQESLARQRPATIALIRELLGSES